MDWATTTICTRMRPVPSSFVSQISFAQRANRLVVVFFLHDSRELFLAVVLKEFDEWIETDFLIHYGNTSLRFIACHDQSREEDLFQFLVAKIRKWEIAELLHYSVFASLKNLLGCVVEQCEITNKHQRLMQQFFVIFILVIIFVSVNEQII